MSNLYFIRDSIPSRCSPKFMSELIHNSFGDFGNAVAAEGSLFSPHRRISFRDSAAETFAGNDVDAFSPRLVFVNE